MKTPLEVIRLYPAHDYTLAGAFESRMSVDPQRDFMVHGGRTWSWGEFHATMLRTARMLIARGVNKGDRVAIMAKNSDVHVLLLFALARIGAIMVPVNTEFGVAEAGYVLKHAAVSAVVCSSETLAVAREAAQGIAPAPWFALIDGVRDGVADFFALIAQVPQIDLSRDISAEDTCLIVYTSGTTGFPKGAMHSQRNFVTCGETFVARIHVQPEERLLTVLPLFHINALFYSLAGTLAAGACIIVVPRFSASTFWQTAVETRATAVNVIEAIGTILIARPRSEFRPGHRITKLYGARANMVDAFRN